MCKAIQPGLIPTQFLDRKPVVFLVQEKPRFLPVFYIYQIRSNLVTVASSPTAFSLS